MPLPAKATLEFSQGVGVKQQKLSNSLPKLEQVEVSITALGKASLQVVLPPEASHTLNFIYS
jgi:hypothetical protein